MAAGKLTPSQVRRALAYQSRHQVRFGEACLHQGFLGATELLPTLSAWLRVPYIFIGTRAIPDAVLALVPGYVMREKRVVPIRVQFDGAGRPTLFVATAEPQNLALLDEIGVVTGTGVRGVLACSRDIEQALERHGILERHTPPPIAQPGDVHGFEVQRGFGSSVH